MGQYQYRGRNGRGHNRRGRYGRRCNAGAENIAGAAGAAWRQQQIGDAVTPSYKKIFLLKFVLEPTLTSK